MQGTFQNIQNPVRACFFALTDACFEDFSTWLGQIPNRLGQPFPGFKSKWGLESALV